MVALSHRPVMVKIPPCGVVVAESVHAPSFRMADRAEPFHKIVYVRAGAIQISADRPAADPIPLAAGRLLAIPAGRRHRFDDLKPATLFFLCLSPSFVAVEAGRQAAWERLLRRTHPVLAPDAQARRGLDALTRRMLAEQLRGEAGWELAVVADALRWLVELARLPDGGDSGDARARVAAVFARLGETFYDPWSLDDAAAAAGLSRRRFTQLFAAVSGGRSFLACLTDWRLTHAAQLLSGAEHSIAGVAFSCGFGDLSHFYRVFRQRYGAAPGQWREEKMEKQSVPMA